MSNYNVKTIISYVVDKYRYEERKKKVINKENRWEIKIKQKSLNLFGNNIKSKNLKKDKTYRSA